MNYRHVVFICLLGIFSNWNTVSANIVINEIAWMGTTASTNDEWVELFNNGTSAVTIDGWTLQANDGSPSINLTGSISAGGYMLLERTDDNTVPTIAAGVIYSGAMSNSGENLSLKNNTEQIINSVDMSSGWVAGDATTKETMQLKGTGWVTGAPTPGTINVTTDNGNNTPVPETEDEDLVSEDEQKIYIRQDSLYSAQMVLPDIVIQENLAKFDSVVKKDKGLVSLGGRFEWTMGDGGSFIFDRSTAFNYTYHYPGNYVVILRYYSDSFGEKPNTIHKQTISVIPASASLVIDRIDGMITITNTSTNELNIGNWKLQTHNNSFTFPPDTIIKNGGVLKVPFQIHNLDNWNRPPDFFTETGYKIPSVKNTTQPYSTVLTSQVDISTTETEELYKSFESEQKVAPNKLNNVGNLLWIIIFICVLIFANILFILIGKRFQESETVANRT